MPLEADAIIDRRRLKRRLNFWRVLAVVAFTAAALVAVRPKLGGVAASHVARVNVSGVITHDRDLIEAVEALAKDDSVPAVIVNIDSPGGSVSGGESLYRALQRVAAAKPVAAVMAGTAASAGYMVALPAERIFASQATLTGSIGVILQTGQVSELLNSLGVGAEAIVSGPLKDQPSFIKPLSPAGRTYLQGVVNDLFGQFVDMVAEARHMDVARVRELADGRAYTGRQAKDLGLVDEIGDEISARQWLQEKHGVSASMRARDVETGSAYDRFFSKLAGRAASEIVSGLTGRRPQGSGAWAIWQGGATQ